MLHTNRYRAELDFEELKNLPLIYILKYKIKMGERPKADPFETYMHTEIDKLRSRNE